MGLTIRAYSGCKPVTVEFDDDDEPITPRTVRPHVNRDFPTRQNGIVHNAWYQYEEMVSFGNTYGGHGDFRRELAELGGYPPEDAWEKRVTVGPFFELVNFADNEGTFGPETCAKLAADFAAHEPRARQMLEGEHMRFYRKWHQALTLASAGGMLTFR